MQNNYQNGNGNQGFNAPQNNNFNMNNQQQQGFQQPQQAPQQQQYSDNIMQGGFTMGNTGVSFNAPRETNRNPEVFLAPEGPQFARIYKVLDIGTHVGYMNRANRKVKIFFEMPQYLQQFQLDSPDLKPTAFSVEMNYFTSEKSTLRKLINICAGRVLSSDQEAANFNLQNFLGMVMLVTIRHEAWKSDPTKYSVRVDSYSPAGGTIPIPEIFNDPNVPRNPYTMFYIDAALNHFEIPNFANLSLFDRRKIAESLEFKQFIDSGRIVFRNQNNEKDNFYKGSNGIAVQLPVGDMNNQGFTPQGQQPQQFQQAPQQFQNAPQQQFQQPSQPQQVQQQVQQPQGQQPFGQAPQMNQNIPQPQPIQQPVQQPVPQQAVPQQQTQQPPVQQQEQPAQSQFQGYGGSGAVGEDNLPF